MSILKSRSCGHYHAPRGERRASPASSGSASLDLKFMNISELEHKGRVRYRERKHLRLPDTLCKYEDDVLNEDPTPFSFQVPSEDGAFFYNEFLRIQYNNWRIFFNSKDNEMLKELFIFVALHKHCRRECMHLCMCLLDILTSERQKTAIWNFKVLNFELQWLEIKNEAPSSFCVPASDPNNSKNLEHQNGSDNGIQIPQNRSTVQWPQYLLWISSDLFYSATAENCPISGPWMAQVVESIKASAQALKRSNRASGLSLIWLSAMLTNHAVMVNNVKT